METASSLMELWKAILVLILPMRNGNREEELKNAESLAEVLILPMRNGNSDRVWKYANESAVLILPMRNGNVGPVFVVHTTSSRSYPTYEEWKHF